MMLPDQPSRTCGTCNMCCKLPRIPELDKPFNQWCPNCEPGVGCRIYVERPERCRSFVCLWLQMPQLPDELRPDRCGVVLAPRADQLHGRVLAALVAPGQLDRMQRPRLARVLAHLQDDGFTIYGTDGRVSRQRMRDGTYVPARFD